MIDATVLGTAITEFTTDGTPIVAGLLALSGIMALVGFVFSRFRRTAR